MALTIEIADTREISLDDYVAYVKETIDLDDIDSIVAGAPTFKRLLNNKQMLRNRLNAQLRSWRDFQEGNGYSGMVTLLEANERFVIRANVWKPAAKYDRTWLSDDAVYSYMSVHDHNFSFMTGGYFGQGYKTSIWEWDGLARTTTDGEHVDLRFLEHTSLPEGKIMLYRTSTDIHRQEHSESLSISLNLLIRPPSSGPKQYRFNVDTSTVISSITPEIPTRLAVCDIAHFLADGDTIQILSDIARTHTEGQARRSALSSLRRIDCMRDDDLIAVSREPEKAWLHGSLADGAGIESC
jgi:hypothetical protein